MIWRTVRIFHISDENIPNIYSRNKLPHSEIPKKFFPRYSFSGSNTKMVEKQATDIFRIKIGILTNIEDFDL